MTTTAPAAAPATVRFRPSFFFWMIVAMALFVFGGFGMHSFVPALRGDFPSAPPVVHLHGLVFVGWMLLLLLQSALSAPATSGCTARSAPGASPRAPRPSSSA